MNAIEQSIIDYLSQRQEAGLLSATAEEILSAIIPASRPELRFKPSYKYAIRRLRLRYELNALVDRGGNTHYFIGDYPSKELRASLGLES